MYEKVTAGAPDEELIRASLDGKDEAFRELMERYKSRAFHVAMGITGNPDDALDVVQEAFVKAYYNLKEFRFGSNFYTWFYRLLVNLGIDRWRKSSKGRTVPLDDARLSDDDTPPDAVVSPRSPEEIAQDRQLADALTAAIGRLPEYHRAVVVLREVDGLSYEEIAQVLKCSVGTVMSRLHYARAKLKEALKGFREE